MVWRTAWSREVSMFDPGNVSRDCRDESDCNCIPFSRFVLLVDVFDGRRTFLRHCAEDCDLQRVDPFENVVLCTSLVTCTDKLDVLFVSWPLDL